MCDVVDVYVEANCSKLRGEYIKNFLYILISSVISEVSPLRDETLRAGVVPYVIVS